VKVPEDLGNHRGIFDCGDDLQAAPATRGQYSMIEMKATSFSCAQLARSASARQAVGEDAAFEKGIKLVFDKVGQTRPSLSLDLCQEGLEVFLYHLV
jgi:hypothetical protein